MYKEVSEYDFPEVPDPILQDGLIFNYDSFSTNDACANCPNNPKNGGSGICHCILGQQIVY